MKLQSCVVILSALSILVGCGGGGGGSGASSGRPQTGFRVMHAGIDFSPADVSLGGEESAALARVRFAEASNYFSQSPETRTINLLRANIPSEIIATSQLSLAAGDVRTLLLYGEDGAKIGIIEDPLVEISEAQSAVRIIHGVGGASKVAASAGGELIEDDISYGSASSYLTVVPGDLLIRVRRASDGAVIFSDTKVLEAGKFYSLLISGEADYFVRGELVEF